MFFSWFRKKTSLASLQKKVNNKHRREWEKRLDIVVKAGKEAAEQGKSGITVPDKLLRCVYNANRPWNDILADIQKRFKDCKVFFNTIHGQTTIEIRWND